MKKIIVLGGGLVGGVIAADLCADAALAVTLADSRDSALAAARARCGDRLAVIRADLGDVRELARVIAPFDVVVGALSSVIGFQTLRTVIECRKPFCDICFMPQDAMDLDALAQQHGVTAVVDIGVAPGMSNMLAGHATKLLDECEEIEILVGGLPRERRWPFDYKAGFSPYDVIEEYVRPSRVVEHGKIVVKEALTERELVDIPGVGTLEAFNTDGLRSLAYTLRVPTMREKTMRYPGHAELMAVLRHIGLFSHEPITVGAGVTVRPIEVISALMFPKWSYQPGEADLTAMRVRAVGTKSGERVRHTWHLLDFYDPATRATSMARTTAFPCAIMARMLARGEYARPGVVPPEFVGMQDGMVARFMDELRSRGVRYEETREVIDAAV